MFNIIFKSSTSLTIELNNNDIYSTANYSLYLNNQLISNEITTNVYSIYNLVPDTDYSICVVQNGVSCEKTVKTD